MSMTRSLHLATSSASIYKHFEFKSIMNQEDHMKTRKKTLLTILLAGLLVFALAACGNTATSSNNRSSSSNKNASTSSSTKRSSASGSLSGKKVLVIYFSGSGTTKDIAEKIANVTGGTLFRIEPSDAYTDADLDWTDDNSRVNKEHNDTRLQDQVQLKTTKVADWDSYDVVFFGYPIWWGDAAWPVRGFAKANDFSGKTVIPFCTSSSSDIGNSGANLKKLANNTGNWQTGHRFAGGTSKDSVQKWVNGLSVN